MHRAAHGRASGVQAAIPAFAIEKRTGGALGIALGPVCTAIIGIAFSHFGFQRITLGGIKRALDIIRNVKGFGGQHRNMRMTAIPAPCLTSRLEQFFLGKSIQRIAYENIGALIGERNGGQDRVCGHAFFVEISFVKRRLTSCIRHTEHRFF